MKVIAHMRPLVGALQLGVCRWGTFVIGLWCQIWWQALSDRTACSGVCSRDMSYPPCRMSPLQRAHQNSLENQPIFLALLTISGLQVILRCRMLHILLRCCMLPTEQRHLNRVTCLPAVVPGGLVRNRNETRLVAHPGLRSGHSSHAACCMLL